MARRLKQNFNEVQAILDAVGQKVDKVEGKNLSTNDYTDEDKAKLSSVEAGAEPNVQGDWDQADTTSDDYIKHKPDLSVKADLPLEDVDIPGLTVRNGYITASGVWNSGNVYCHTLLPVSAGKAVRVTAAESNLFRYAWLTSGRAPRGGIAADLVPGTERTDVAAGSSVSLVVPDGAKYLYVYLGTPAAKANTPESMAVSDTIASLRKDTDTNAGDIAVLGEEARHSGVYGHFDGAGTSISDGGNIYVVAGMSYRLTMLHPDITVTDPTGNVWRLVVSARDDSGDVVSNLVQVSDVSRLSDHYDLTIPAGATRLYIYGRCAAGQTCDYVLERLDTQTYNDGDILTLNPDSEFLTKWQSAMKPYYTSQSTSKPNCVRFLHLSDVHGNWANVRRFLKFYNHWVDKGYDITAINTGDTATDYLTDGVTGYTGIAGADKILGVIGNHDTRGAQGWQQYKGLEVYDALFAPLISGWGVVQPEGAAENGYCYYHKDYASNKLRLVVVDIMGYDDTEDAWLASVLASAKTAGYHVLIATHFAGGRSSAEASQPPYKKIDCQWSTMAGLASDSTQLNGYNSESYKMADTVHAFMEDGGIFCGYMCGHSHLEFVARLDKYPDQMIYTIGSSKSGKVHDYTHTAGTRMQDEFEIVAVDTDSKFVKLYKVGANYDRRGRLKDSICVSYDTHEVVGFPVTTEALAKEMDGKQEKLVSGENIKTINGQSVLGSGDIQTGGGSADAVKYTEQTLTDAQKTQARTNIAAASESEVSQLRSDVGKIDVTGICDRAIAFYVRYSDGVNVASGSHFQEYWLDVSNYAGKTVRAQVGATDTVPAAIAFYSSSSPSSDTYIKASSVQMTGHIEYFEATIPSNAKLMIVTNRDATQEYPIILIDSGVLGFYVKDFEEDFRLLELTAPNVSVPTADCEVYADKFLALNGNISNAGATAYTNCYSFPNDSYSAIHVHGGNIYSYGMIAFYKDKPLGPSTLISVIPQVARMSDYYAQVPLNTKYILYCNSQGVVSEPSANALKDNALAYMRGELVYERNEAAVSTSINVTYSLSEYEVGDTLKVVVTDVAGATSAALQFRGSDNQQLTQISDLTTRTYIVRKTSGLASLQFYKAAADGNILNAKIYLIPGPPCNSKDDLYNGYLWSNFKDSPVILRKPFSGYYKPSDGSWKVIAGNAQWVSWPWEYSNGYKITIHTDWTTYVMQVNKANVHGYFTASTITKDTVYDMSDVLFWGVQIRRIDRAAITPADVANAVTITVTEGDIYLRPADANSLAILKEPVDNIGDQSAQIAALSERCKINEGLGTLELGKYTHHQNVEGTSQPVPSQSLYDIAYAKALGFRMIEANCQVCSDGVTVIKHGVGGKLGNGLTFAAGSGITADTLFSAVSSTALRQNVTYDNAKYNGHIPTLDEFCAECARLGMVPFLRGCTTAMLAIARKYLPDERIIVEGPATRGDFKGMMTAYGDAGTAAGILAVCEAKGRPFYYCWSAAGTATSELFTEVAQTLHANGYLLATAYIGRNKHQELSAMGLDINVSTGPIIPDFVDGATLNITSMDDQHFTLTGATYDSANDQITMVSGDKVEIAHSEIGDGLAKMCVRIIYSGDLTIRFGTADGNKDLVDYASDGSREIVIASALLPTSGALSITANAATTIKSLKVAVSKI